MQSENKKGTNQYQEWKRGHHYRSCNTTNKLLMHELFINKFENVDEMDTLLETAMNTRRYKNLNILPALKLNPYLKENMRHKITGKILSNV